MAPEEEVVSPEAVVVPPDGKFLPPVKDPLFFYHFFEFLLDL
jgi:hypothetical protein